MVEQLSVEPSVESIPNSPETGDLEVSTFQKEKSTLVHVEPLKKIVECALISPYIHGEKPFSLLITAKAESGKTSVMKLYRQNKGVVYLTGSRIPYRLHGLWINKRCIAENSVWRS